MLKAGVLILGLGLAQNLFAHGGEHPHEVYPWYVLIAANLIFITVFYGKGWRTKGTDRKTLLCFGLGLISLIAALFPPIDNLSNELLSVHMVQHMLLMMVAAPFLVFAYSDYFIKIGLNSKWKRRVWTVARSATRLGVPSLTRPLVIGVLYAFILWLWHLPYLYESALDNRFVHNIQHLLFFAVAYFFWKVLLRKIGNPTLNAAAGILYLFVASVHSAALGVLMAFSPSIWYQHYADSASLHGLTALEDQQIAGYIMWMPAGTAYVLVMVWLAFKVLNEPKDSVKAFGSDHG